MGGHLVPRGVRSQGSIDVTEAWTQACYGVALHLLIRARAYAFNSEEEAAGFFRREAPEYLQQEHNRKNNKWGGNKGAVSVGDDGNANADENHDKNHDDANDNPNNNKNNNDLTNEATWPPCFDKEKLKLICWDKMIFVDKKHLCQKIGGGGALDLVWAFLEDEEGNLDVENGKEGECLCELKMKYEKEGQYAFACVAKAADGETKREAIFTYTGELM